MKNQQEIETVAVAGGEPTGPTVKQRWIGMYPGIEDRIGDPVGRR
jgi:hypothetical protein